ncbi:MAG: beta-propeller domain-containing protein [Halobacteriovoraceae bacterium]|nr:beta-propeller domain-containing protein [Halobacteriovoraceae bacterium]
MKNLLIICLTLTLISCGRSKNDQTHKPNPGLLTSEAIKLFHPDSCEQIKTKFVEAYAAKFEKELESISKGEVEVQYVADINNTFIEANLIAQTEEILISKQQNKIFLFNIQNLEPILMDEFEFKSKWNVWKMILKDHQLIVLTDSTINYSEYQWHQFDLSKNTFNFKKSSNVQKGSLHEAGLIGDQIVVATQLDFKYFHPRVEFGDYTEQTVQKTLKLIQNTDLKDILNGSELNEKQCQDALISDYFDTDGLTTLHTLNLKNSEVSSQTIFSSTSEMSISPVGVSLVKTFHESSQSALYYYSLNKDEFGGVLLDGIPVDKYSISQKEDSLRVAFQVYGEDGWRPVETRIGIYTPAKDFLVKKAELKGLGKGQRFMGAHFESDRVYLSTFEVKDPFYVIDLSEEKNPKVLGELEIPGFSDSFFPLSNDLILGLGGNWVKLYDVSDETNPLQIDELEVQTQMSTYDHQDITLKETKDFVVIQSIFSWGCGMGVNPQQLNEFSLLKLENNKITKVFDDEIRASSASRSFFQGSRLYTVSDLEIVVRDLGTQQRISLQVSN